ncbi:hypothetical protein M1D52_20430 [Olivibacter sp. SA151]|uniref:hypothetical protein n=1 Tax=Olivibacter jilunii TaxID=985016 RepID=UPI003F16ECA7
METGNKIEVRPLTGFQKIKIFGLYPILAIQALWCIAKIDTFTIDWRLLPLVLFIIAGVTHTIGIAYYYKYSKEREITRSTGMRKTGNYFLSTAGTVAFIGFLVMFDIFRIYQPN